jgi:3-oxoadipate enol-lactonase
VSGAVEVRFRSSGVFPGPAVVLLNSLGTDLRMWDPQLAALEARHRVVRLDCRGHGESPVPPGPYAIADLGADVLALMDRLGIARAALCGVSLGGATALWLAAHAPERVSRLAVCFSSDSFGAPDGWTERAALVRAGGTAAVATAVVRRWFTPALVSDRPELAERMRAMLAAMPAAGYAACCEAIAAADLGGDLAAIAAPTLVISGSEDEATPPEHGRRIAAAIPGARFVELERVAHLGNLERPEAFNALLLDHLGRGLPVEHDREAAG